MNDCMWTVFCISEESYKFKRNLANHQIYKTQTIQISRSQKQCCRFLLYFMIAKLGNRILEHVVSLLEPLIGSLLEKIGK